jgi:hypothetical protein
MAEPGVVLSVIPQSLIPCLMAHSSVISDVHMIDAFFGDGLTGDDPISEVFLERCARRLKKPPPELSRSPPELSLVGVPQALIGGSSLMRARGCDRAPSEHLWPYQ